VGGVVAFEWFGLPVLFFSGAAILAALLVYVGVFKDVHGWLRPRPPDVLMVWGPDGPGAPEPTTSGRPTGEAALLDADRAVARNRERRPISERL